MAPAKSVRAPASTCNSLVSSGWIRWHRGDDSVIDGRDEASGSEAIDVSPGAVAKLIGLEPRKTDELNRLGQVVHWQYGRVLKKRGR